MTRETKIGLLVGLAFIIVIGILLSHQLEQSTEPPSAQIAVVGTNVRNGVAILGNASRTNTLIKAPNVSPDQTVPTPGDLQRKPATAIVNVGPARDATRIALARRESAASHSSDDTDAASPAGQDMHAGMMLRQDPGPAQQPGQQPADVSHDSATDAQIAAQGGIQITGQRTAQSGAQGAAQRSGQGVAQGAAQGASQGAASSDDPRIAAAREHGEELVFLGHPQNTGSAAAQGAHAGGKTYKTYKAQPGDSLSRIAARFFGQDSPAAEDAIVRANPSLAANRNLIIAGRTYNIPASAQGASTASSGATGGAGASVAADSGITDQNGGQGSDDSSAADAAPAHSAASASEHFYTVKKGDTLWGIATSQLGTGGAVAAIEELNKDVLKGGTTVREGMKLRLPAKSVASADE